MLRFAGFPLSAWAFALRTWAAMMLALYVAFWLQLENGYIAAFTVGILSLQTRGQAYQKALYQLLMTVVGVVASIVIAGLLAQARDLFVIAYGIWLGLCVYVGGLLDGNRAAGVVLAGFTVAFVAVSQIDSPQSIFFTGVDRGAGIAVGITALALVNDAFLAPNLHTILSAKLAAMHQRVRTFALAILRGESADPIQSANLLREITALHPDISALVIESSAGWARGAAGRTAAVALVAEMSAAGALASLPAATLPSFRGALARAMANAPGEDSRALRLHLQQHMHASDSPYAQSTTGPYFGLVPGQQYTLRWASTPKLNGNNVCPGDNQQAIIDLAQAGGGSERGFIESTSASVITSTIVDDYQSVTRSIGDTVTMTGGAKQTELSSLIQRVNQDNDVTSLTFAQYMAGGQGTGRRIVGAPINTGSPNYQIVQIGAFFLLPASQYSNGGNSLSAPSSWERGFREREIKAPAVLART